MHFTHTPLRLDNLVYFASCCFASTPGLVGEGRKGLGNGEMGGKDYRSCVFPLWGGGGVGLLSTGHLVYPGNIEGD